MYVVVVEGRTLSFAAESLPSRMHVCMDKCGEDGEMSNALILVDDGVMAEGRLEFCCET